MEVKEATLGDLREWLRLARQVQHVFGSMVTEHGFQALLRQAIQDGSAYCVREEDGEPGTPLCGGILISREENGVSWVAVAREHRRKGVAVLLMEAALELLDSSRPVSLTTFDAAVPGAEGVRKLYEQLGFRPQGTGERTAMGFPTEVFIKPRKEEPENF